MFTNNRYVFMQYIIYVYIYKQNLKNIQQKEEKITKQEIKQRIQ